MEALVKEWHDKSLNAWKIKCHLCSNTLHESNRYFNESYMCISEIKRNDVCFPKEPICCNCLDRIKKWGNVNYSVIWHTNKCTWCKSYYITENEYKGKYPRCIHCLWYDKIRLLATNSQRSHKNILDTISTMMMTYIPVKDVVSIVHKYHGNYIVHFPEKNHDRMAMIKRMGYNNQEECIII